MYERFQAVYKFPTFLETSIREAAKKVPLMAGPFRPNPPPLELLERWKKVPKKVLFSLMARPSREELFLRLPLLVFFLFFVFFSSKFKKSYLRH